jgi:polyphosphate kinase 2 (PPK2 family)
MEIEEIKKKLRERGVGYVYIMPGKVYKFIKTTRPDDTERIEKILKYMKEHYPESVEFRIHGQSESEELLVLEIIGELVNQELLCTRNIPELAGYLEKFVLKIETGRKRFGDEFKEFERIYQEEFGEGL